MDALEAIYANVCGLDVHKKTVVACRRRFRAGGKVEKEVKTFATTTAELLSLLEWLDEWQVSHVAMASTGVYWQPVWNILEGHVDLWLVNARHLKMVPGRKTDVKDGEWIAQLLQYGLLRASVVPSPDVRQWRDVTRHRAKLIDQHTSVVNRVHKTLEDANSKLSSVISDIRGVSGRRMLHALALGQDDVSALCALGGGAFARHAAGVAREFAGQAQRASLLHAGDAPGAGGVFGAADCPPRCASGGAHAPFRGPAEPSR